jgi:hypothetical protein
MKLNKTEIYWLLDCMSCFYSENNLDDDEKIFHDILEKKLQEESIKNE